MFVEKYLTEAPYLSQETQLASNIGSLIRKPVERLSDYIHCCFIQ